MNEGMITHSKHMLWKAAGLLIALILQTQMGCMAMADDDVLKFSKHDLHVDCYSASDLYLVYAGTPTELSNGKLCRAKTEKDETRYPGGIDGTYRAFEGPVQIEWHSRDGTPLKATVDLDAIFKDRKILHKEDPARIYKPLPIGISPPLIIIEVNDRTVNVYMFVTVELIPADPKALSRDAHDNRTLAYSKTF